MIGGQTIAVGAPGLATASLPFYLYGAWIMVDRESDNVTWPILV